MKENKVIELTICDFCGIDTAHDQCNGCKKDICWDCKRNKGIIFPFSVHFEGSYEGFYCSECLSNPRVTSTEIFKGYKQMSDLRNEYSAWWKDFDLRCGKAQARLKILIERAKNAL